MLRGNRACRRCRTRRMKMLRGYPREETAFVEFKLYQVRCRRRSAARYDCLGF